MGVRFPNNTNRTCVIGPTGSGKTVFGIWLLSTCKTLNWKRTPVIILDFKGDDLIEQIEDAGAAKEIDIRSKVPKKPGLYIVRPHPHEKELVDNFLWRVWAQGNVGVFVDEGYMLDKCNAFNAILTQGRSKKIPVLILVQRPAWLSRFVFSESQYFAIFNLNDKRDKITVQQIVNADLSRQRLPYHCLWYDVGGNAGGGAAIEFSPVPSVPEIVSVFAEAKQTHKKRTV